MSKARGNSKKESLGFAKSQETWERDLAESQIRAAKTAGGQIMMSLGFVAVTASSGALGPLVPEKAGHTNDFDYQRRAKSRSPCRVVLLRLQRSSLATTCNLKARIWSFADA